MQIRRITLKNIRSYVDQEVAFPTGTVLLSGDIGSGKSSILYAIDFALFGITKDLSGSSLLRNGAKEGSVELEFDVDGKIIEIRRTLRRGGSVAQHYGHLIVDGNKKELTAVELKQRILELLQYPPELLTKKSLIYRYTVYTPQDEMKSILLGDDSVRVDTLRRVFGIDKYKRIGDHASQLSKRLRGAMRRIDDSLKHIEDKKQHRESLRAHAKALDGSLRELEPRLAEAMKLSLEQKNSLALLEEELKLVRERQRELHAVETELRHHQRAAQRYSEQTPVLEKGVIDLSSSLKNKKNTDGGKTATEIENAIQSAEKKAAALALSLHECTVMIKASMKNISDLAALDVCPLCKQTVQPRHVHQVTAEEQKRITELERKIASLKDEEGMLKTPLEKMKGELQAAQRAAQEKELLAFQEKTLEEKRKRLEETRLLERDALHMLKQAEEKREKLAALAGAASSKENAFTSLRKDIERLHGEERAMMVEQAGLRKERDVCHRDMEIAEKELSAMEQNQRTLQELSRFSAWLQDCFLPLMDNLERHVMLRIHHDFDHLFQKWFMMLVDSELMRVRLNDAFMPVIEQNGYETEYGFLSGGEKTAAALAYRLALNHVINTIVGVVKTKDLLILDEPTDGFSADQLDKLRDLLDELDAKQIIIVSHEDKVESFVDTVIRVEKREHVSEIIS